MIAITFGDHLNVTQLQLELTHESNQYFCELPIIAINKVLIVQACPMSDFKGLLMSPVNF